MPISRQGVGFDVMLKNYGNTHCVGSSGPIGMNGWYANGQAYVYLQGELGVKVNLLFIHTRIPIIQGAAAALLQAELPNPSWFAGYLGVQFDLLGGLVKGSMRMKISLGDQCDDRRGCGQPCRPECYIERNAGKPVYPGGRIRRTPGRF